MRRRRPPDEQARGLSSGGSGIASWAPAPEPKDGLEQLAGGDATVSELAQPHGVSLPAIRGTCAFSRTWYVGKRSEPTTGNTGGRIPSTSQEENAQ